MIMLIVRMVTGHKKIEMTQLLMTLTGQMVRDEKSSAVKAQETAVCGAASSNVSGPAQPYPPSKKGETGKVPCSNKPPC